MTKTPEPDLVDRIFDYLQTIDPELTRKRLERVRGLVRAEFAGEMCYVASKGAAERLREKQEVLSRFNGRNATTVARELGISRAQVYRHLKQPRRSPSLNFYGNETPERLRSAESTALRRRQKRTRPQWQTPPNTSNDSEPPSTAES